MRIQYASDLHLEFSANSSYLKLNPLDVVGEIMNFTNCLILKSYIMVGNIRYVPT